MPKMLAACEMNWERVRLTLNAMQAEQRELKAGALVRDKKIAQLQAELSDTSQKLVVALVRQKMGT